MTNNSSQYYDVAVIGGGLAGGAAAAQLAKRGVRVLLLEREIGPHHKVCGEFLSYEAQYYLSILGINLRTLGAEPIHRLKITRKTKSLNVPLPFQAMSLSRHRLDGCVLNQALLDGAEVRYGVPVANIRQDSDCWHIVTQNGEFIRAKTIFLATGKHDIRGWQRHTNPRQDDYIGFKMHFYVTLEKRITFSDAVDIILYEGGYAGLEPIENGKANLCLVVTKKYFSACGKKWSTLLHNLIEETPSLAAHLNGATPCWDKPITIFGIPYGYIYRTTGCDADNFFRLGDQMVVIPSLCGDGMALALHTSFMAVEYYLKSKAAQYHRNAYLQLSHQIHCATRLSALLSSRIIQPMVLPFCAMMPVLVRGAINRTRLRNILT